ncbi:DUF2599 domain-containing protein [Promicromonospora sp. NPDC060204]|uniref:DUF2599 domain-containing protein n=1 Tax=Promicromonospora sp. NPDC060204 TaxID=3347071 RepID=UPI00364EF10C
MQIRRAVASPLAACAALATVLAVGGCSLIERAQGSDGAGDPTATASQPTPTPTSTPSSEQGGTKPKAQTSTVTVGDVVLEVSSRRAAEVREDELGPGTRTVTLSLGPEGSARLSLTSPGALDVDTDGSISVLDGNGTPVAAIAPPEPPSDAEDAPRIEVTDIDATQARLRIDDRSATSGSDGQPARTEPVTVTFVVGTESIESTTWGENEGGRSLAVDPADWARSAGEAGLDLIRTQLVAAEPEADSDTMEHQLVCHAVGAMDKETWNLEPWRPDVGLILTATAHCNPV